MKKIYRIILILLISIMSIRFVYLYFYKHDYYYEEYLKKTNKIMYGLNAPRGRILDRNGKILVDNKGVNTIVYYNMGGYDEKEIAEKVLGVIDNPESASSEELKKYYYQTEDTYNLLTKEEQKKYSYREITESEKEQLIYDRLDDYITKYTLKDSLLIHYYNLLTNGYTYSNKIIKKEASASECAGINSLNINGLRCEYNTKRVYLYDTLKTIFGTVGSISKENKDYYLDKGYSLNDEVGLSYLEKEYDDYLKGTKAKYLVNKDNTLTLLSPSKQGNDIILSIDIDLQLQIEEILKKNISLAESLGNTEYYNSSYVIVSDPNTGEIIASSGLSKVKDNFYDVTPNILTSSFTPGSIVKGASISVGYQNNLIEEGKKINDACVKLYQVPSKCSFKRLGYVDDITALKTSSNYYQFILAIKLTGNNYKYNMKLNATEDHFNTYRNTFASFGLGSQTGIDLEGESTGIKGETIADDLLLNLSIGQYDTYTPLQLTNYINTIATDGNRYALHYLKEIKDKDNVIYTYPTNLLSTVNNTNFPRIKEGLRQVVYSGSGRGYTNTLYKPAGKTGTSETYYSKNITTINQTYAMYAPYDNPKYSLVVVSPNISYNNDKNNYIAPINRYISKEVSKILFEN